MKTVSTPSKLFYLFTVACFMAMLPSKGLAQVGLSRAQTSYTQNFDGLPSAAAATWENGTAIVPGLYVQRTTSSNTILVGTGSSNAGGLYSFGLSGSADRALGAISSGTATVGEFAWGILLQNNTGSTITALNISFVGEQWRSASKTAGEQKTTFWYSTNSSMSAFNLSPKSDQGWTAVPSLDFKSIVNYAAPGALNGNLPANRRLFSETVPVQIAPGEYVMLRWKDLNDLDDDHGLAIDDFNLTWSLSATESPGVLPVELISFTAKANGASAVALNWETASEKDNSHFVIERSSEKLLFTGLETVSGQGTTSQVSTYSWVDEAPLPGTSYYRLKQVDIDGSYTYSGVVAVARASTLATALVYPTITKHHLTIEAGPAGGLQYARIIDVVGKQVLAQQLNLNTGKHTVDVGSLGSGTYTLVLTDKNGQVTIRRFQRL